MVPSLARSSWLDATLHLFEEMKTMDGGSRPTVAEYRIPEMVVCLPALRKPSHPVHGGALPAGSKKFFVPPSLEAVFAVHKAY